MNWSEAATTDADTIATWWSRWPEANIGIATGPISNLFVLDVDTKDSVELGDGTLVPEGEFTLEQLTSDHGELETLVARTGSGGQHFYFTYPTDGDYGNRTRFAPGLDIRAEGGYVIGPGSNHESGHDYEWIVRTKPTGPPAWLLHRVEQSEPRGIEPGEVVGEGGRNAYLTQIAGRYRGKIDADEPALFGILMSHNARFCDPPLDADEVQNITRSAMKFAANAGDVATWDIPSKKHEAPPEIPEGHDLAWQIGDFLGLDIQAPRPLVQGLLDEGTGILLVGPPNVGKSWLIFQLGLALATGQKFLGHYEVEKAPVLIIDEEGHDWGDQKRLEMLVNGMDLGSMVGVPLYLSIGKGLKLDNPAGLATVRRMIGRYGIKLVIFDSLVRVHNGDENTSRGMAQFFEVAKHLMRTTGAAFLFTHHVRKSQAEQANGFVDVGDMIRGSSEIKAFVDTALVVLPGDDMEVHVNKQRWREKPAHPFGVRLMTRNEEAWAQLGYQGPVEKEGRSAIDVQNRIMTVIQQIIQDDGEPTADLISAWVGLGVPTVKQHLGTMTAAGRVKPSVSRFGGQKMAYRSAD